MSRRCLRPPRRCLVDRRHPAGARVRAAVRRRDAEGVGEHQLRARYLRRARRHDHLDGCADLRDSHRADVRELRARTRVPAREADGQRRRVRLGRRPAGARPAVRARHRGAGARRPQLGDVHQPRRRLCHPRRGAHARPPAPEGRHAQPAERAPREGAWRVEPLPHHRQQGHPEARRQRQGGVGRLRHLAAQGLHRAGVGGRADAVPQHPDP